MRCSCNGSLVPFRSRTNRRAQWAISADFLQEPICNFQVLKMSLASVLATMNRKLRKDMQLLDTNIIESVFTKNVLDHHLACFGAGDLEGVLSDYAPDAVMFTPDGTRR